MFGASNRQCGQHVLNNSQYHRFLNSLITPSAGFWFDLSLSDECPFIPHFLKLSRNHVLSPTCSLLCIISVGIINSNRLTPNNLYALYLQQSGITADCFRCCLVAFSVNFACTTLILHPLLKSYGVVFECRSDDKLLSYEYHFVDRCQVHNLSHEVVFIAQ